ncbi:diaminopimelate epimerase [Desulfotomaculum arcticum]|uniref:Diaminopimelate epimerase n=1 Tax=Desulfotruncus arcticus DSM 17038 TaxID=1121424 RepID=A0A1I2VWG1_9FIRM|nr:diaminopimelate epimerase [Desulfotruncus arcticus]SFG93352.1 diaminopimelate epimerase [Desulfotomaculum arcticum] [Desulfotruncus arcticus DSM 17038]
MFFKYHALGNDYIVIDPAKTSINLDKNAIRLICHRNFGVGSDGILYGPLYTKGNPGLKIFNPDGSEAEKSGNGIRIFSRYLVYAGYVYEKKFFLETLGGRVLVEVLDDSAKLIKVDMGTVTYESTLVPVKGRPREVINEDLSIGGETFRVTCLSIGNPHCVIPLSEISRNLALKFGPKVENHELFPNRINMQLLKVIDRNNIQIEIWERGAGYTMASGSSSCAAASAAHKLGLVDNVIKVHMPGGQIDIEITESGHVYMTGPVTGVAEGKIAQDLRDQVEKHRGKYV